LHEPFLLGVTSHHQQDWRTVGFDGNVEFEPQLGVLPGPLDDGLKLYDYTYARKRMTGRARDYAYNPCVFVSWDNTPRRGEDGIVFINATPEAFEQGVREAIEVVSEEPPERRLVFINAWNEWAEGNYLEPDHTNGMRYLEALAKVSEEPVTSDASPFIETR
jgi:hypothetical protein